MEGQGTKHHRQWIRGTVGTIPRLSYLGCAPKEVELYDHMLGDGDSEATRSSSQASPEP
jgi:hypothetical protein